MPTQSTMKRSRVPDYVASAVAIPLFLGWGSAAAPSQRTDFRIERSASTWLEKIDIEIESVAQLQRTLQLRRDDVPGSYIDAPGDALYDDIMAWELVSVRDVISDDQGYFDYSERDPEIWN